MNLEKQRADEMGSCKPFRLTFRLSALLWRAAYAQVGAMVHTVDKEREGGETETGNAQQMLGELDLSLSVRQILIFLAVCAISRAQQC